MMKPIQLLLPCILALSAVAQDLDAPSAAHRDGPVFDYAVLLSGLNGAPEEQQRKSRALLQLERALRTAGVPDQNIVILADAPSLVAGLKATAENLEQAIEALAERATPDSTVLFFFAGQTNIVNDIVRVNLPGHDVTHLELAQWLNKVRAGRFLLVFDCPCAGVFTEPLTGPGRIILCAARADQPYSTRFSDFFLPAWTSPVADYDNDGLVSVLEAFQYASLQIEALYDQSDLRKTEIPLLEDNGDGVPSQRPWAFVSDAQDGEASRRLFVR